MKAYILSGSIVALAVALLASVFLFNQQQAVGSVIVGNEYQAVQITSTATSGPKTAFGSIGSVVISDVSAGGVRFYDTASSTPDPSLLTDKLLFQMGTSTVEGTYQYDVSFSSGLLIVPESGFNGDFVVTYR